MREIAIITPVYNSLPDLKIFINTLAKNTDREFCLVLIDNGSGQETKDYIVELKKSGPIKNLEVITNEKNMGFAYATNQGMKLKPDHDIVWMNSDMIIPSISDSFYAAYPFLKEWFDDDPKVTCWLSAMQEAAYKGENVALVSAKILFLDGRIQAVGAEMLRSFYGVPKHGNEVDVGQCNNVEFIHSAMGTGVFIKRDVLNEVGLLDEAYESYYEDTDLCERIEDAGWLMLYLPITLVHVGGSTRKNNFNNKEYINNVFNKSRETYITKWKSKYESKIKQRINFFGHMNQPTGYSSISWEIYNQLVDHGIDCFLKPLSIGQYEMKHRIQSGFSGTFNRNNVSFVVAPPSDFDRVGGKKVVGLTMIEGDNIPNGWVNTINGSLDRLVVPNKFNKECFENNGVTIPISVVLFGVDPQYFNPDVRQNDSIAKSGEFRFFYAAELKNRKNLANLIKAFFNTFPSLNDGVTLVVKVFAQTGINTENAIKHIDIDGVMLQHHPLVKKINFIFTVVQPNQQHLMASMYTACNCGVFPTRGEAIGMPQLEMLACGIPVITTITDNMEDYYSPSLTGVLPLGKCGKILAYEKECGSTYNNIMWDEPDFDSLCFCMETVYKNYKTYKEHAIASSLMIRQNLTWENTAKGIINILEQEAQK